MAQSISRSELKIIEQYADMLFKEHDIDIEFQNLYKGTHFFDRLNDPRNDSPITVPELKQLFKKVSVRYGDKLSMENPGSEGVLKDMQSNINIPFILKWDDANRELDLIPKTIMKKKNFVAKDNLYKVESSMKLVDVFRSIITEVGDSSSAPSNAKYNVHETSGQIKFKVLDDEYIVSVRLPVSQNGIVGIIIDFTTEIGEVNMTNKHIALKVMSYVVGSIEQWLLKFKEKYSPDNLQVAYIKYNPKSESDESGGEFANKRDRLYRAYLEKFAKRYGSSVTFSTAGGISAIFNPKIQI